MAKISTYPILSTPTVNDLLIGTDVENLNETKNFSIGDIGALIGQDYVPYVGATGNVNLGSFNITGGGFIVGGGTASQFLKADGSLDSTLYTPQTRTITINGTTYNLSANRSWDLNTIDSLTTTGTSGAATYIGKVLNIPVYQAQGSYITQISGEATGSGPGNATVTLDNTAVISKILTGLNVTGGTVVSTDTILQAFGKVQNQINGLTTGVTYQGVWNAATNVPFLQSSVGTKGYYYVVDVAGNTNLNGITDWQVGDWAIYNGTTWDKVDNTDAVVSVNGYVGAVVLTASDVGAVPTTRTLTINGVGYNLSADRAWTVGDVRTDGSYANPSWITSLGWSKITGTPTTLAGYGITDGALNTTTLTINGTTYDLTANRSWSVGTVTSVGTSGPLTGGTITGSGTIGITQSSSTTDGYLSSADWNAFNSKQGAISVNAPLTFASGVIGITQSGASSDGYLSSTDWNTFNSKVAGSGTANTLPMWGSASSLINSPLSYAADAFNFQYNSSTGGTINFTNIGLTTYTYSIQMNNFGSPRSTIHSYTDGLIIQSIGGAQVSRMFGNGNLILGTGTVDNGYKLEVTGDLYVNTIANAATDTDRFIVSDGGLIKYRTGAQVLIDIGAQGALTLTTTGSSGPATLIGDTLNIPNYSSSLTGYVPYTGATQNVNLGEYGLTTGFLGFDLTPTGTPTTVGTMYWDSFYRTPSVVTGTGATTLQIGQEEVLLVHNNTGSALTDGQVVYVTGSTGELPSVSLADASSETTSAATLGVVTESIANGANGFVTVSGIVHGINTLAYTEGDILWLSETAGQFTNVKPVSPAHLVLIGYVIKRAGGNGSILVKIQNTQELSESSDVLISSPKLDGQGLFLQTISGVQLWRNRSIADVLGYTPVSGSGTTNTVPKFTGTTSIGDSSIQDNASEVSISKRLFLSTGGQSILLTPNLAGVSNRIETSALPLEITTTGSAIRLAAGGVTSQFNLASTGVVTLTNLAGTGTRIVTADASGNLSASSALSGYVPYTGATGAVDLGTNAFSASQININGAAPTSGSFLGFKHATTVNTGANGYTSMYTFGTNIIAFKSINGASNIDFSFDMSAITPNVPGGRVYTLPDASGTLALTSNIPSGIITGSGTTNYVSKFTGSGTIGNSQIFDNGTNVGINQASPTRTVDILGASGIGTVLKLQGASGTTTYLQLAYNGATNAQSGYIGYNSSSQMQFFTNDTLAMTINSNRNVGIGTASPSVKLHVQDTSSENPSLLILDGSNTGRGLEIKLSADGLGANGSAVIYNTRVGLPYGEHIWQQAGTQRMRLDNSGNLGLGVTPSAGGLAGYALFQIAAHGTSIYSGTNQTLIGTNVLWSGGSASYSASTFATLYNQQSGQHQWFTAPSGTAGNAISFTQAMTLTSGGNLLVGTTSDNGARLQVSGAGTISAASTDYALTLQNIQDDSQGLLIRSTDNDGGLYLIRAQSSNSSVSQTWVDRFTLAKNGAATFSSSLTAASLISAAATFSNFGSETAAVVAFADGNTGFFRPALNTLGITTAGTERMRITSSGDILIGETSDGYTTTNRKVLGINGTNEALISFRANGTAMGYIFAYASAVDISAIGRDFTISAGTISPTEKFRIAASTGNVGIGTSSPSNKLDIQSANGTTYAATPQLRIGGGGVNNSYAQILFSDNALSDGKISYFPAAAEANRYFSISARQTESDFVIRGNGNVLIGTTTDVGARLYVDGAFRTGTLTAGTQTAAVDWRLGNARGGTATANALVRVQINGVLVDLIGNYV